MPEMPEIRSRVPKKRKNATDPRHRISVEDAAAPEPDPVGMPKRRGRPPHVGIENIDDFLKSLERVHRFLLTLKNDAA